jgi:hypothetical protein
VEREVTGQLAAGCEELVGELTAFEQTAELEICKVACGAGAD